MVNPAPGTNQGPAFPPAAEYVLRTAAVDEFDQLVRMISGEFGWGAEADAIERERLRFEPDRHHVIACGDDLVASAAVVTADLTVPGTTLPAALVTAVAVEATHRRRGLLRRLMTHQLTGIHAAGRESIAVLWASEGRIYQRYGYGLATRNVALSVDSREVSLRAAPARTGWLRSAAPAAALAELRQVYQRVAPSRPGWFSRSDSWWASLLIDPVRSRDGAAGQRATLYESHGQVDGYALWRMRPGAASEGGPWVRSGWSRWSRPPRRHTRPSGTTC